MSAAEISHAIQEIGFLVAVRESAILYPVIMATHLGCIALFGGLILVTDLRLLGVSMTKIPLADLLNGTRIWKRIGLTLMLICGLLLATSEMDKYYANPYFQIKLGVLVLAGVHALVFRRSVYANAAELDKSPTMPGIAKLCGWTSLLIWIGILSLGRWIAYYESPDRRPGGALNPTAIIMQHSDHGAGQTVRTHTPVAEALRRS